MGSGLPAYFSSAGLGSKVSTCDAPPLGKMWIIRFALPGKWGRLGASGLSPAASSAKARPMRSASAKAPTPSVERQRSSRRVRVIASVQKEELVRQQQRLGVLLE